MAPSRPIPTVGMRAVVRYLATELGGVVETVTPDARSVTVRTETGETIAFVLNRTTARYQAPQCGPRLALLPD